MILGVSKQLPNVRMFSLCVLLTRSINTYWSKGIDKFCSGGIKCFGPENSHRKNQYHELAEI